MPDITGIIDSTGVQVVSYSYNTWGVITGITGTAAQTVGRLNPLRYRGYKKRRGRGVVFDAGTSNFSSIMASNGDDLRDQLFIMYGIMLYNEDN